jgi:hypothetical protein
LSRKALSVVLQCSCRFRITVRQHAKKLGRHPTPAQLLELTHRRERLQARINAFNDKSASILPGCTLDRDDNDNVIGMFPLHTKDMHVRDFDHMSDSDDSGPDSDEENPFQPYTNAKMEPENEKVHLPSSCH